MPNDIKVIDISSYNKNKDIFDEFIEKENIEELLENYMRKYNCMCISLSVIHPDGDFSLNVRNSECDTVYALQRVKMSVEGGIYDAIRDGE